MNKFCPLNCPWLKFRLHTEKDSVGLYPCGGEDIYCVKLEVHLCLTQERFEPVSDPRCKELTRGEIR